MSIYLRWLEFFGHKRIYNKKKTVPQERAYCTEVGGLNPICLTANYS
jgi:hypothetical protein